MADINSDLSSILSGIAKKAAAKSTARIGDVLQVKPTEPPLHIILFVHRYKCKNCGRTEEHTNTHLMAAYPPNRVNEHYHATTYIGAIPPDIPAYLEYTNEEKPLDYCQHCFPWTARR